MPSTTHPRFREYGVYDRDTGEEISTHSTRGAANAAKGLRHDQRVRGVVGTEIGKLDNDLGLLGGFFGRLLGGRR